MATAASVVVELEDALAEAQALPSAAVTKIQAALVEAQELAGGGGSLPAWVPAPGQRANISLNLLKDVDPCPARNCAFYGEAGPQNAMFAWCGAAYVEDDGALGSIVFTGGGHGDYYGNEVYRFPFSTRLWERLTEPSPYPGNPLDPVYAEFPDGTPAGSHTYQHMQQLRTADGGGPQGSTLMVCRYAAGQGARPTGQAHRLDHATRQWSRYSNQVASMTTSQQATCFDTLRRAYWKVGVGGQVVSRLDTATRDWTNINVGWAGGNNFAIEQVAIYHPGFDWLVLLNYPGGTAPVEVWRLKCATSTAGWLKLAATGDVPTSAQSGPSFDYAPSLNKACVYQRGDAFIRYLVPPTVDTGPWTFTVEAFTGDVAPPTGGTRQTYNRMRWIEKLKSWAFFDGVSTPVQLWRAVGT